MSSTTAEGTPAVTAAAIAVVPRVADPAPLGLAAFAMTTFALSIANPRTSVRVRRLGNSACGGWVSGRGDESDGLV